MPLVAFAVLLGITAVGIAPARGQGCDPDQAAKLLASDGAMIDRFGYAVSLSGERALIGTHWDDDNGSDSGSAYLFEKIGGTWIEQFKLLPDDGGAGEEFGYAVSLSGETALIGARRDSDNGFWSGSAYVFEKVGGTTKLVPGDGAGGDEFGIAVSIDGDTALVGAHKDDDNGNDSGSAYIFEKVGGTWVEQAKLLPADGAADDLFGWSVSISGETALVGALYDDDNGSASGSVYVFERVGGVWVEQAKLLPGDGAPLDAFGVSASISGDVALIGAPWSDDNSGSGSAYIFEKVDGTWVEQAKLLPGDGAAADDFGWSVSISGERALIGAHLDDDNFPGSGSAYIFEKIGGVWVEQAKLLPDDPGVEDDFGWSVSISGETALIGAYKEDDNGNGAGAAYLFDLNCSPACPADFNGDGVVNTQDFLAFLGAWSAGDPLADWNSDGVVNTQDFLAYLADWAAGCP